MIEIKAGFEISCRSCGVAIEQGETCYAESFSEPVGNILCQKCMTDPSIVLHKVVKIDPEGRFIFFVDKDTPRDALFDMSETIREWWKSGDRFLWALSDVTLVRLSDNGEAEVIFQEGEEV